MARRRGWGGHPPQTDGEAAQRVVEAAVELIDTTGAPVTIADVASSLGVTRQTVYRYFPTADALMRAAAVASVDGFFDRLTAHVRGLTDPAEALTEGTVYTLEAVRTTPHLGVLLSGTPGHDHTGDLASAEARDFGMRMIDRFDVDWDAHGFTDVDLHELVEFALRIMLSFFVAPDAPARTREQLRAFLRRWLGGAIEARQQASARY